MNTHGTLMTVGLTVIDHHNVCTMCCCTMSTATCAVPTLGRMLQKDQAL